MKYYKLIKSGGGYDSGIVPFIVNKIYSGNFKGANLCTVEKYAFGSEYWKEVPAGEYFVQEGIMPEYFAIKMVADNPLWGKYIDWLSNTYFNNLMGCANEYYGFDSGVSIHAKLEYFKNNPVELTLEQWYQIINKTMEEEFKLPKVWFIQLTEENKDIVRNWHKSVDKQSERRYDVGSFYGVYSDGSGDAWSYSSLPKNTQVITTEQFIKYVLNQEVMKEKEIIGWKLKEDCKQYRKAIERLVDTMCLGSEIENLGVKRNSLSIANLKQAGVLELWFEPAYKEEILQFGGYGVTFEKVTSGVRISCNGETGTFSQIQAIYNYFKPNSTYFKFGSQEVKGVKYADGSAWHLDNESDNPTNIKIGCTTGTWEEFVAIHEKAKSML